jgi:hypothetical protein
MKIYLRIQYLEKIQRRRFHGQPALTAILSYLNKQSLLEKINYIAWNDSSRRKKIESAKSLIEESGSWKEAVVELTSDKATPDDYFIKMLVEDPRLWFLMGIGEDKLSELDKTILEHWKGLLIELNKAYSDSFLFGPTLAVEVYDLDYTASRPERNHPLVKNIDIVSVFSKKFQKEHRSGNIKELDRLMKAKLPPSARVEKKGDLVFFYWASSEDLADEKRMKKRLAEKDRFLAAELNAPIAEGRNESGDEEVPTEILSEHPPLTFYDELSQIGYKAVVINKKGKGADGEIAKLAKWLKEGKLPDETPILSVGIIVPGREEAVAVRQRAKKAGIDRVFYVDNDGRWWNPFSSD